MRKISVQERRAKVPTPDVIARFWAKVVKSESGCWEWKSALNTGGYGTFSWAGATGPKSTLRRHVLAHRFAWQTTYGTMPHAHLELCHTCDNRACVRPDHLFLGTHSDNMRDKKNKGRAKINQHNVKTHCKNGHPYAGDNLRIDRKGWRKCVACAVAASLTRSPTHYAPQGIDDRGGRAWRKP